MAHRDGAAIDVDLFRVELEELLVEQDHGGKGFVELEQVNVRRRHTGALQYFARHFLGPGQHDARFRADRGEGANAGARLELHRGASLARPEKDRGRTVDDPRGVTAVMDVLDRLDLRVALHRDGVEPEIGAELSEGRLEPTQGLHRRAGAHMLVALEQGRADLVLDRYDRAGKAGFLPRPGCPALALDRVEVDIGAGEGPFCRDQVGTKWAFSRTDVDL